MRSGSESEFDGTCTRRKYTLIILRTICRYGSMLTQRKDKPQPCQSCRLPDDRERLGGFFLRESLKLNEKLCIVVPTRRDLS